MNTRRDKPRAKYAQETRVDIHGQIQKNMIKYCLFRNAAYRFFTIVRASYEKIAIYGKPIHIILFAIYRKLAHSLISQRFLRQLLYHIYTDICNVPNGQIHLVLPSVPLS